MAEMFGAIALEYERGTDFFGRDSHWRRGPRGSETAEDVLDDFVERLIDPTVARRDYSSAERRCRAWAASMNGADPFVHRAVYQLIRALQLRDADFYEESIVALDGVTSVVAQFMQHRLGLSVAARSDIGNHLQLPSGHVAQMDLMYRLRSSYGAHPAWSKWWDFGEMFEGAFEDFLQVQRLTMWRLLEHEGRNRRVVRSPASWSSWFGANAAMLYQAVWWPLWKD